MCGTALLFEENSLSFEFRNHFSCEAILYFKQHCIRRLIFVLSLLFTMFVKIK